MKENVTFEIARDLLLDYAQPDTEVYIDLSQALGRIISQDIRSNVNIPSFPRSPVDGFAIISSDTLQASHESPVMLRVTDKVWSGGLVRTEVLPGTAIKIKTGAAIPYGADAVIKYEETDLDDNFIKIYQMYKSGRNIIRKGEDLSQGELVAQKGTRITPPLVGLLAGMGIIRVPVFEKVMVAVLSTGDELIDPYQRLQPGKIINSSLYCLEARCREIGTNTTVLGICPDGKDEVIEMLKKGMDIADVIIVSGGVSSGENDVIKNALYDLGARILFWKVAIKPGSPMVAAVKDNKLIIGLSGNPAAALVIFDLMVSPVLKKMLGNYHYLPIRLEGVLENQYIKPDRKRRLMRAQIYHRQGLSYIKIADHQGNGDLKSFITCNALADIPAGKRPLFAGQELTAFVVGSVEQLYQTDNDHIASSILV